MDLQPYVETIQQQLLQAAEAGGDEARRLAERLVAPLSASIRLAIQDALAAAVEEITVDLAPASVELRLRGRDPEFVVARPAAELPAAAPREAGDEPAPMGEADEGGTARINLRLPDQLKARVEAAARGEGLSVNTWLVRAAAGALRRVESGRQEIRVATGGQRFTGWAR